MIQRREFITLLSGAAAWPLAARAQQPAMPLIGSLQAVSAAQWKERMDGFRRGLGEVGFAEGRNVAVEYRWAEGQFDQLPAMVTDFIDRKVAVLFVGGSDVAIRGAISATKAIPIVFATGSDPVAAGFVPSLARPRGNVTGISVLSTELGPKRLELLHELLPGARKIALMVNPNNSAVTQDSIQRSQAAAHRRGLELVVVKAGNGVEIESAIASAVRQGADAINIGNDGYLTSRGRQIAFFALRHGLPTMSNTRENVASGVLMSYGASYPDAFQKVGVYAGRILKGEKPADLPVLQPTRFELFINLTTAKAVEKGVILRRDWRSVRTWNRLKP